MEMTTPLDAANKAIKPVKVGKQVVPFETEELRLKQKCLDLKKRIMNAESQNEIKAIAIARSHRALSRLQFEYSLLLESLERKAQGLPIADLKVLQPMDLDGSNIESLTVDEIKQVLNSTSDFKQFDELEIFNKLKMETLSTTPADPSSNVTAATGKKRSTSANTNVSTNSAPPKKKARDPREPKRPTNAYLFFCDAERERIKNEWIEAHPNEHIELTKVMTETWKKLNDEEKKPYYEMYEKDKLRYHKAVEEFAVIKEQEQRSLSQTALPLPANGNQAVGISVSSLMSSPVPSSQQDPDSHSQTPEQEPPVAPFAQESIVADSNPPSDIQQAPHYSYPQL